MSESKSVKMIGSFLVGIASTFQSLNALTNEELDKLTHDIGPNGWYPIDNMRAIFDALDNTSYSDPILMQQAGSAFIQAWYDNGGKELGHGSIGHFKLQDNSNGAKLVFKDYDPEKLFTRLLNLDVKKGTALIEAGFFVPLDFFKGIFYNGFFMWGDLLWLDVECEILEQHGDYTHVFFKYRFKHQDYAITNEEIDHFVESFSLENTPNISAEMAKQLIWKIKGLQCCNLSKEKELNKATRNVLGASLRKHFNISKELEASNKKIKQQSITDFLTGLYNKRYFDHAYDKLWHSCRRRKELICVYMIDVDNFKLYNDHYGHLRDDECLKSISESIKSVFRRPQDITARFGGEEFVIVVNNIAIDHIDTLANQLLDEVARQYIPHSYSTIAEYVTISIGSAHIVPTSGLSPDSIIKKADLALYEAKNSGKNCHLQFLSSSQSGESITTLNN